MAGGHRLQRRGSAMGIAKRTNGVHRDYTPLSRALPAAGRRGPSHVIDQSLDKDRYISGCVDAVRQHGASWDK